MGTIRPRLAAVAVLATSLTVLAAGCASTAKPGAAASGSARAGASPSASAITKGALLLSNGTDTVTIAGRRVTFPTTVTDAAWSPSGSRIAFVDAAGNIATARPDGTDLVELTTSNAKVTRSDPAWLLNQVVFQETPVGGGVPTLKLVTADGTGSPATGAVGAEQDFSYPNDDSTPPTDFSAPSSSSEPLTPGVFGSFVFQHQAADGPEVWIFDQNQREPSAAKLADGSEPAVAPNGSRVAFIAPDGHLAVLGGLLQEGANKDKPVEITGAVPGATHLTWNADGTRIAFTTATGIESVAASPSGSAAANTPQPLASAPAVASYLSGGYADQVDRVYDADPIAEAVAASKDRYPTVQQYSPSQNPAPANGAVLAAVDEAPAATLAAQAVGPLLLTQSGANAPLDPRTAAELQRIFGKTSAIGGAPTITIVGGTDEVSDAAEASIRALGYITQRVSNDPYTLNAQALATAQQQVSPGTPVDAVLVSGNDPALIASVRTGEQETLVLTRGSTMPEQASAYIASLASGSTLYVVGAQAQQAYESMAESIAGKLTGVHVVQLVGADDEQTSAMAVAALAVTTEGVVLADASSPQQLAVGLSAAWGQGYPLLLVTPGQKLDSAVTQYLEHAAGSVDTVVLVGSPSVLGTPVLDAAGGAISGPLGWSQGTLTYTEF